MISANDVTFIIPIYKLGIDRLNNLKFILPHIIKTGARVLAVEQVKESATSLDLKEFNSEHLLYVSKSEEFHKTGIINWAVKNHANTKYVWVNDVDFYMKFNNVLGIEWTEDFIKPYSAGKKLTSDDSTRILRGEKLNVSYEDESAQYISLYGALSFIFDKEAFLNIDGMDESLFGWGKEDIEFDRRLKSKNIFVQEIDHKGIHLWHPVGGDMVADVITNTQTTLVGGDMAIITCYFNWCGFMNPTRNFNRFLRQMDILGYPVYGVELSLNDRFETTGRVGWKQIQVDKKNICFQKEACINLAEKFVPKKYKKIAWIDFDLEFTNKNWYFETSKLLDQYKAVQMYQSLIGTDKYGRPFEPIYGHVSAGGPTKKFRLRVVPGGAWAARRELWNHGGLYPYCPLGGGDTVFLFSAFGAHVPDIFALKKFKDDRYDKWSAEISEYLTGSIHYTSGTVVHEWHGDKIDRKYSDRQLLFREIIPDNIVLNSSGILEIRNEPTKTYDKIVKYFQERNEDGARTELNYRDEYKISNSYDYCVVITTCDRGNQLKLVLDDINKNCGDKRVLIVIFDDGSIDRFNHPKSCNIKYIKYVVRHGKQNFWKLFDSTFKYLKNVTADYYFYLQDDVRLADGFFTSAINTFNKIDDPNKISLGTLVVESQRNKPKWTNFYPIEYDGYCKTQWCETFFVVKKEFFEKLNYEMYPINAIRWKSSPILGSGVGAQISERLCGMGCNMYHVSRSLLEHGDHESKMNPEDRKSTKLIAII